MVILVAGAVSAAPSAPCCPPSALRQAKQVERTPLRAFRAHEEQPLPGMDAEVPDRREAGQELLERPVDRSNANEGAPGCVDHDRPMVQVERPGKMLRCRVVDPDLPKS